MVFSNVWWDIVLASAHIEDWDTKSLFGRLLGWAAMAVVGDTEVGREKRARGSVNLNFIPLGFSYMLVSLSSSVPTSVLPSWENKPPVYCGGEGRKSPDWAEVPEGTPRSNCLLQRPSPSLPASDPPLPLFAQVLVLVNRGVLRCELAWFLVFLTVLCFLFQNCVSVVSSIIFVLSDLYLKKQTWLWIF